MEVNRAVRDRRLPDEGWRAKNRMSRFQFDPAVWSGNVTHDGEPNVAETFGGGVIPAWTWDRLAEETARHHLPWIAKCILTRRVAAVAAAGQVPLLLDSGVRTGADVFLAPSLGATAVVIGGWPPRPRRRRRARRPPHDRAARPRNCAR